jgi:hypothetical protein
MTTNSAGDTPNSNGSYPNGSIPSNSIARTPGDAVSRNSKEYRNLGDTRRGVTVEAQFDIGYNNGEGKLTFTKKLNGRAIGTKEIVGAFSGKEDALNNSSTQGDKEKGVIPHGKYTIRIMNRAQHQAGEFYENAYPGVVRRPWFVLDSNDSRRGNDRIDNGVGENRDGLRLHYGRVSIGCITTPLNKANEWQDLEAWLPAGHPDNKSDRGKVIGTMEVYDSRSRNRSSTTGSSSSVQAANLTGRLRSTAPIRTASADNLRLRANSGVPVESVSTVNESTGAMTGRAEVVVPKSNNNRRELGRGR